MNRVKTTFLYLLLFSFLLSGCGQEPYPEDLDSGALIPEEELQPTENRIILPENFSLPYHPGLPLDPITGPDGMQQVVSSLLYEGLFRLGPDFEPIPWLCSTYTYEPETFTYTFTLRDDIVFSDGSPLTSADVKTTLQRAKTSERYASRLSDVSKISGEDNTVTILLSAPNAAFPALLDIPIVKAGTETDLPIGTGPYLFSLEATGAWLIANQSWWRGVTQPADRIALVEAADQDTKLYRFTSHDVQLITADLIGTNPISATGNVSFLDANTTTLQYLGCNVRTAPLDSAAFRKALSAGINRSHIVNAFLSGHALPAQFPISPVSPIYPELLEVPFSHENLSTSLDEINYIPERSLSLLVNEENRFKVSVAQYLADSFTKAGVPTEVSVLPWEEYTAALASGNFDLYYGEIKLTADWDLSALLFSTGALNYGGWSNPQTDRLLADFSAAADRSIAAQTLCKHLQLQSPVLPLCFKSSSVLVQSNVLDGLTPTMNEPFYNFSDCILHLDTP